MQIRRIAGRSGDSATSAARSVESSSRHSALEALEPRTLLASVTGAMAQFQAVTISFIGPYATELQNNPNPFLDYRLQVNVTSPSGRTYSLPGYFNGDGNGGSSGNVWQARFSPDETGTWRYTASFRHGSKVAIDLNPTAGSATNFNGDTGTFYVGSKQSAPGFTGKGRLEPAGFYYRFEDGTSFVKVGANEPENFLGYTGFDNTPNGWHKYSSHAADWRTGDPDWGGGRGKAIIGAVNYLASTGINALYFLTQNVGGQTKDVWPWAGNINRYGSTSNDNLHYDLSKLAQWDIVFNHMQRKGIMLHFVFAETEEATKRELDDATLGTERKLYYRELIARFGHHNALQWNINEEYCWRYPIAPEEIKKWAGYIRDVDPFDRPLTVHSQGYQERTWGYFVGDSRFDAASLQYYKSPPGNELAKYGDAVEYWRDRTAAAGRPIVIGLDEARETSESNQTAQRKEMLWHTLLSGGHLEWSTTTFAWNDDLRRYDSINRSSGRALSFMKLIPFQSMKPADSLVSGASSTYGGAQVFAKSNDTYAVYFPSASSTGSINLSGTSGSFVARWYNPRTGSFEGSSKTLSGGGTRTIGSPPSSSSEDWALLISRDGNPPPTEPEPPAPPPPPPPPPPTEPNAPAISHVAVINPDSGQPYFALSDLRNGATLQMSSMPSRKWNFEAFTSSTTSSVKFSFNGSTRIENAAPYAAFGDSNGTFSAVTVSPGSYTLKVTPYSSDNAAGTVGATLTINFTVVDSANRSATPTFSQTPIAEHDPITQGVLT